MHTSGNATPHPLTRQTCFSAPRCQGDNHIIGFGVGDVGRKLFGHEREG